MGCGRSRYWVQCKNPAAVKREAEEDWGPAEVAVSARGQLILKRASRPSVNRSEDDYDVLAEGIVVGRIMRAIVAPVGSPWFGTLAYGCHHDRRPTHGYAAKREAAMTAFAKSWRRDSAKGTALNLGDLL
jgi:hypothetical protein